MPLSQRSSRYVIIFADRKERFQMHQWMQTKEEWVFLLFVCLFVFLCVEEKCFFRLDWRWADFRGKHVGMVFALAGPFCVCLWMFTNVFRCGVGLLLQTLMYWHFSVSANMHACIFVCIFDRRYVLHSNIAAIICNWIFYTHIGPYPCTCVSLYVWNGAFIKRRAYVYISPIFTLF